MSEPQKPTSWWQTLPGVLTALAAVLTAVSGLVALLFQNGILGGKTASPERSQPAPQAAVQAVAPDQSTSATATRAAQPATRSWSDTEAVVLNRDGTTTRVRADSFSNCISASHDISFEAGQTVPFERMSDFEVLQSDDHTTPNAKARLKVKLLDGTVLSGTVDATCDLFGYNSLGRFTTYWDRVRIIRFE